jgi:hypothetical protein
MILHIWTNIFWIRWVVKHKSKSQWQQYFINGEGVRIKSSPPVTCNNDQISFYVAVLEDII